MREQSPEQIVKKLERKFWIRRELPLMLFDAAISAFMITGSAGAITAYEELHKPDTLPHD